MKPIELTYTQWIRLSKELHKDYPTSVLAIKEKTKKVLGFTSREYRKWIPNPNYNQEYKTYELEKNSGDYLFAFEPEKGRSDRVIHLDFYDEAKRTFFLLKYSEFL